MTRDLRIYQHPDLLLDRGEEVWIDFEGSRLRGFTKEPVSVALFAAGQPLLSRSMKFHRPRGMFCVRGICASCSMRINGVPDVRSCRTLCCDGMRVERQAGIPSTQNDLLAATDLVFRERLAYQTMMTRPAVLNRAAMAGFRRLASFAGLPDLPEPPRSKRGLKTKLAVIGSGPAGITAALAAQGTGADVVIVEMDDRIGGRLVHDVEVHPAFTADFSGQRGFEVARSAEKILRRNGARILTNTMAIGVYQEGVIGLADSEGLIALEADRVIIATGAYDQNRLFPGNDVLGVFSAAGMARMVNVYGICPAVRCYIYGSDDTALSLALRLPRIGVRTLGVVEPGDGIQGSRETALTVQERGVPIFINYRLDRAFGKLRLKAARFVPGSGEGEPLYNRVDLLVVARTPAPAFELAAMAGAEVRYSEQRGGFHVVVDSRGSTAKEPYFACGQATGVHDLSEIVRGAAAVGAAAGG